MVEVAHEALIRQWTHLIEWVETNREFLAWQHRVNATRKKWEESGQPAGLLLRGLPLREAEVWLQRQPDSLSPDERTFVISSQHRKRKEQVVAAIGAAVVLWVIGTMTWLWQKDYDLYQAALKIQSLVVSIHVPPQMVQIPGGSFQQGDVEQLGDAGRNPVRRVTITAFAMGQYEVTFEEYDHFAIATGRRLPEDQGWGREQRPIMNVSWEDAKAYVKWLSEQTGQNYRLPTESEWEYAARSGAKQDVWAGTSEDSTLGEYAVFRVNSDNRTAEVGKKAPNKFGLYDLSGNVWEWVEDCAHATYDHAPQDGSAWLAQNEGDCDRRVVRGGSWNSVPANLRASSRILNAAGNRGDIRGFRLVQELSP